MDSMLVITLAAVAVAAIMSLVSWRVLREERRRSDARIAALAADIHSAGRSLDRDLPLHPATVRQMAGLGAPEPRRHELATLIGAAVLVVGSIAAIFITMTSGPHPVAAGQVSAAGAQSPRPAAAATPQPLALELVALSHEREGDRLTVRGIVRNPGHVAGVSHLNAVVMLFNAEGRFLTSGRVPVSTAGLAAGTEAPFVISVPGAADVGRYRVSFRSDDRVVPHVDRRTP